MTYTAEYAAAAVADAGAAAAASAAELGVPAASLLPDAVVAKGLVLAFAAEYPTPNVAALVAAAEAGQISWHDAEAIAAKALAAGLAAVAE
jgi:hypothetical protein